MSHSITTLAAVVLGEWRSWKSQLCYCDLCLCVVGFIQVRSVESLALIGFWFKLWSGVVMLARIGLCCVDASPLNLVSYKCTSAVDRCVYWFSLDRDLCFWSALCCFILYLLLLVKYLITNSCLSSPFYS